MKVSGCYSCVFYCEYVYCDLENRDVSYVDTIGKSYPDWCPLLKGPIVIELDKEEPEEF